MSRDEPGVLTGFPPRDYPTEIGTPALQDFQSWNVERRADGAVLVRVHSSVVDGRKLPDAVFAFRVGDPQFSYWDAQLRDREILGAAEVLTPITYTPETC